MITDEYLSTCRAIELESTPVLEARFEAFLVEQGWLLYSVSEVTTYLRSICPKSKFVTWCPLTQKDRFYNDSPPYDRLIPLRVLRQIQDIRTHFTPEEAHIHISDFRDAPKPDPFARVRVGSKEWVFAVWDEPGF